MYPVPMQVLFSGTLKIRHRVILTETALFSLSKLEKFNLKCEQGHNGPKNLQVPEYLLQARVPDCY